MDNQFQVILKAILDTSSIGKDDIAKVQQIIDKYKVNLDVEADTDKLLKTVKSAITEINKSLDSEHQLKIDDGNILKAIQQTDKLTNAMARGREKSEQLRESEKKRQELAQNNASNKALEQEYALREKIKSYQSGTSKGSSLETDYLSVEKSYQSYEKLGVVTDKLKTDFAELKVAKTALDTSNNANLITNSEKWNTALATVNNTLKQTKLSMQSIPASANEISSAIVRITNYMSKNTAMDKAAKTQMQGFITTLKSGNVSKEWIKQMNADLATTDARLRSAGKLGLSFFDKMKAGFEKFGGWSIISGLFVKGTQAVKSMFNNVVDLNTAMTNLYKVTDETDSSYNKFLD